MGNIWLGFFFHFKAWITYRDSSYRSKVRYSKKLHLIIHFRPKILRFDLNVLKNGSLRFFSFKWPLNTSFIYVVSNVPWKRPRLSSCINLLSIMISNWPDLRLEPPRGVREIRVNLGCKVIYQRILTTKPFNLFTKFTKFQTNHY